MHVAAFVGAAGDADDPRALLLRQLAGHRADRARGGRDDDGLAGFRLADVAEPDIGGHPRHAEHAERGGDRRLGRVELQQSAAQNRAVELPAIAAGGIVAGAEIGVVRAHHLADDATLDDLADLGGLGIGPHPADAAAHIRVEREIDAAQQDLARPGLRQRPFGDREILGHRQAGRPPVQQHLSVSLGHVGSFKKG
jgi:hypothetical protein